MIRFNLYLPQQLLDDLTTQAAEEGVPVAEVMRRRLQASVRPERPTIAYVPRPPRGEVQPRKARPSLPPPRASHLPLTPHERRRILAQRLKAALAEDARDAAIAEERLKEIAADPSRLIGGEEVQRQLDEMLA